MGSPSLNLAKVNLRPIPGNLATDLGRAHPPSQYLIKTRLKFSFKLIVVLSSTNGISNWSQGGPQVIPSNRAHLRGLLGDGDAGAATEQEEKEERGRRRGDSFL